VGAFIYHQFIVSDLEQRVLSDLGALPNRLDSGLSAEIYSFVQHGYTENERR
jgi:hypothetical protein